MILLFSRSPIRNASAPSLYGSSGDVLHMPDLEKEGYQENSGFFRPHPLRRRCFRTRRRALSPSFVKDSKVQCRTEQRPLGSHGFQPPYRPASKTVVLFDLPEAPFDELAALLIDGLPQRGLQFGSHGLHHFGVRPDFNLPAFGIAGALRSHGAILAMAAVAFHALSGFVGMPFIIQSAVLGTGHRPGLRIVIKVEAGVGIVMGGFAFGGWHQHRQLLFPGRLVLAGLSRSR